MKTLCWAGGFHALFFIICLSLHILYHLFFPPETCLLTLCRFWPPFSTSPFTWKSNVCFFYKLFTPVVMYERLSKNGLRCIKDICVAKIPNRLYCKSQTANPLKFNSDICVHRQSNSWTLFSITLLLLLLLPWCLRLAHDPLWQS